MTELWNRKAQRQADIRLSLCFFMIFGKIIRISLGRMKEKT